MRLFYRRENKDLVVGVVVKKAVVIVVMVKIVLQENKDLNSWSF